MVAGSALGCPADCDLPAPQSLHAVLGGGHAAADRNFEGSTAADIATPCGNQAAASSSTAGLLFVLRVRDLVVRRHLLLDLQRHASIRGGQHTRRNRHSDSVLSLS